MASRPLTIEGTVACGHSGKANLSAKAKLKVGGNPVLVKADIVGAKFDSGCALGDATKHPPKDNNGNTLNSACKTVLSVTAGEAAKLKVNGAPVVLDSQLQGTTDGMDTHVTPLALLAGSAVQTKLTVG